MIACENSDQKTPLGGVIDRPQQSQNTEGNGDNPSDTISGSKILITYFTVPETDGVDYEEKSDNARPELATHIENLSEYDVIFVGFPNWNADLPMPLYSFFEEYDFSQKILIPFVTHGGSGFSSTIRTIKKLEPDATVIEEGLSVSRNNVATAESDVKSWAESLLKD